MSGLFVGLMSGTSMDGIDAAAVRFRDGATPILVGTLHRPWPDGLRARLRAAARGAALDAAAFARLDHDAGACLAEAATTLIARLHEAPRAIGSHGQTLVHLPTPAPGTSLQIGNPAVIAERTGVTTVADFRRRDLAAGGQGAPLVPAFHQALFRTREETRVIVNIGGIANLTRLPAEPNEPVTGFDTGPGNCLMDAWIAARRGLPMDRDGALAASGRVRPDLLERLLDDPYFRRPPPKSTGTEHFSPEWLSRRLKDLADPDEADVQATLLELTVHTIAEQIGEDAGRVLVCGGGARNRRLMERLAERLPCPVEDTGRHGCDPEWVEAMAFAWLAWRTLEGRPGNLPAVTGAAGPRILGAIHPA